MSHYFQSNRTYTITVPQCYRKMDRQKTLAQQ